MFNRNSLPRLSAVNLALFPIFLITYSFLGNVSNDIYMPSMPILTKYFSTNSRLLQLTLTAWFLGTAAPQLILGAVTDRVGRRPVILIGGIIFVFSTLFCALASNIIFMIVARFFQGMGVCSLTIVSFVAISELYNDEDGLRLLNYLNIGNSIAPLIGPLLGSYLFITLGWQSNFYLIFLLSLVCLIGIYYFMPESKLELDDKALNLNVLLKNYKTVIYNSMFMRHALTFGLLFSGMIAYLTGAPFILIDKFKLSPQFFGYTQLAVFGAFLVSATSMARLSRYFSLEKIIKVGLFITLLGGVSMFILGIVYPANLYAFISAMMCYGFGFGLACAPLNSLALSAVSGGAGAALLGFWMTGLGSLASFSVSLCYNGTIISVAIVITIIPMIALILYYFLDLMALLRSVL